jgi:hypothetical protein
MTQPDRATIHVVTPGQEAAAPPPPSGPPSVEPEAQPPITAPPPQEQTPDLGGSLPNPTPDERVQASGGSVADRMRAQFEGMAATEEFGVPGWELKDGRDGLILEVRAFGDRTGWNAGISNEVFIAKSTHALWCVNDDGSRDRIEGGWGPTLAGMIGHPEVKKASDLVALVISKPDPNDRSRRIPNVAGIGSLAAEIVGWSRKSYREAEENLGE